MNPETSHPAEPWEPLVTAVRRRAVAASVALGLTVASRVYEVPAYLYRVSLLQRVQGADMPAQATLEFSDTLVQTGAIAQLVLLVVTGTLFLRWLHLLTKVTRGLGGDTLRWQPGEACWGFVIPFLNITRPYQVVRDLHDHLAPDVVPEPQAQVVAGDLSGYRGVEVKAPPPPVKLPHAAIGAWWGTFWVGNLFANFAGRVHTNDVSGLMLSDSLSIVSDSLDVVSAALAVVMVRGVTARLAERDRRVRHNPAEVLAQAGVTIDPPLA
jgi:hypothetical protein